MGRLRLFVVFLAVIVTNCILVSCGGGGNGTNVVANPVPAIITLAPFANSSIELGKILTFTATPERGDGTPITTPVQFISSDNSVVTVAANGLACAGSWDSLANPQICTPGKTGVAQVHAEAQGISSPITTVYVHQHVDKVVISLSPSQPALTAGCISKGTPYTYQANAFSLGTDVTATVGPFGWSAANLTLASIQTVLPGLALNQARITGNNPGVTTLSASAGSANSIATQLVICPVKSITVSVNNGSATDVNLPAGTSLPASATVTDIANNQITDVPLTWSSSNTASIGVAGNNSTAVISAAMAGGATILASCTPPTCNVGFQPSKPVYADQAIRVVSGSTGGIPNLTILTTSDGCANLSGCFSTIVPIAESGSATTPNNSVGAAAGLPSTPNSLVFPFGTLGSGFLGTDFSQQGTKGLMVLSSTNSVSQFPSAPGKVLAVSPDGSTVIVSDTADTPNQLYWYKVTANSSTPYSITGATAAGFSPDSMKAFVAAGNNLYLFSNQDAMQTFSLNAPANGVAFLPQGGTAAISGGTPSGITLRDTITGAQIGAAIPTPHTPVFIKALPDGKTVVAVDSPGLDLIDTSTSTVSSLSFGQGNFTPKQFFVSTDGSKAYILASDLPVILVMDLNTHVPSVIALSGGATPLAATLTPDGGSLYVGGSDDQVHVINTNLGLDIQQVTFEKNLCVDSVGNSATTPCLPDIIAVRP